LGNKWIVDVLTDLHAFASVNSLPGVALKIEEALSAARTEIGMVQHNAVLTADKDNGEARHFFAGTGTSTGA
jgi:hypothetical protein